MTTILFLWYLVTTPADKFVCSLWVPAPPTREQVIAACGTDAFGALRLDVYRGSAKLCSLPASHLITVLDECKLDPPLDNYYLHVVQPDYQQTICSITLMDDRNVTTSDVYDQCPQAVTGWANGTVIAQFVGTKEQVQPEAPICAMPAIPAGTGLFEMPASANELKTNYPYALLAGRLIWFGYVTPACEGSGLDPETLAADGCGMAAAYPKVIEWQNQFDGEIWSAAQTYHVPAVLLKRVIGLESQFWPSWKPEGGEITVMQITDDGLDILLRYDDDLANEICPLAVFDCSKGYPRLSDDEQAAVRAALSARMRCDYCTPNDAAQVTRRDVFLYARLLKAYYCYTGAVSAAAWENAVVSYHAGPACAFTCPEGQDYFRRLQ